MAEPAIAVMYTRGPRLSRPGPSLAVPEAPAPGWADYGVMIALVLLMLAGGLIRETGVLFTVT